MKKFWIRLLPILLIGSLAACAEREIPAESGRVAESERVTLLWRVETAPPETTAPETTALETTAPPMTAPETAAPETTAKKPALETKALPPMTAALTVQAPTVPAETEADLPAFAPNILDGEYSMEGEPVIEERDGFIYVNGILIVNKRYPLPKNYDPAGLAPEAQAAFNEMKAAAAEEGITLKIISGYRSYRQQDSTYQGYVKRDGQAAADRYSARPGHSEHQSGYAMDLNSLSGNFGNTAAGKWIAEHCAAYGFLLRYPEEKEAQTGYMYEPWHLRFLTPELAKAVTESGLCLEEYLGITSEYAEE